MYSARFKKRKFNIIFACFSDGFWILFIILILKKAKN